MSKFARLIIQVCIFSVFATGCSRVDSDSTVIPGSDVSITGTVIVPESTGIDSQAVDTGTPLEDATVEMWDAVTDTVIPGSECQNTDAEGNYQCIIKDTNAEDVPPFFVSATKQDGQEVTYLSTFSEEVSDNLDVNGTSSAIAGEVLRNRDSISAGVFDDIETADPTSLADARNAIKALGNALAGAIDEISNYNPTVTLEEGETLDDVALIQAVEHKSRMETQIESIESLSIAVAGLLENIESTLNELARQSTFNDTITTNRVPKRFEASEFSATLPPITTGVDQTLQLNRGVKLDNVQDQEFVSNVVYDEDFDTEERKKIVEVDTEALTVGGLTIVVKQSETHRGDIVNDGEKNFIYIEDKKSNDVQGLMVGTIVETYQDDVLFKWVTKTFSQDADGKLAYDDMKVNKQIYPGVKIKSSDSKNFVTAVEAVHTDTVFSEGEFSAYQYFFPRESAAKIGTENGDVYNLGIGLMSVRQDNQNKPYEKASYDGKPTQLDVQKFVKIFNALTKKDQFWEMEEGGRYRVIELAKDGTVNFDLFPGEVETTDVKTWTLSENDGEFYINVYQQETPTKVILNADDTLDMGDAIKVSEETEIKTTSGPRTIYLKDINRFKNEMIFSQTDHDLFYLTFDDNAETVMFGSSSNTDDDEKLQFTYHEESKTFTFYNDQDGEIEEYRTKDFYGTPSMAQLSATSTEITDNGEILVHKRVNIYDDNNNIIAYEDYVNGELKEKVNYVPLDNDELFLAIRKSMGESDNELYSLFDEEHIEETLTLTLSEQNLDSINGIEHFKELEELDLSNNNIKDISVLAELKNLKKLDLRGNPIEDFSALDDLDIEELKTGHFPRTVYLKEFDRSKGEMIFSETDHDLMFLTIDENAETATLGLGSNEDGGHESIFTFNDESKILTIIEKDNSGEAEYRVKDFYGVPSLTLLKMTTTVTTENGDKSVHKLVNIFDDNDNIIAFENYLDGEFEEKINYVSLDNDELFLAIRESMGESDNVLYSMFDEEDVKNFTELELSRDDLDSLKGLENFENIEELIIADSSVTDFSPLKELKKLKSLKIVDHKVALSKEAYNLLNDLDLDELEVPEGTARVLYHKSYDRFKNELTISKEAQGADADKAIIYDDQGVIVFGEGDDADRTTFTYDKDSELLIITYEVGGKAQFKASNFDDEPVWKFLSFTGTDEDSEEEMKMTFNYDENEELVSGTKTKVSDGSVVEEVDFIRLNNDELFNAITKSLDRGSFAMLFDEDQLKNEQVLDLSEQSLEDISGLENFVNLVELDLSNNNIQDISVLAELKSLKKLDLRGNPITDFSALDDLELDDLKKGNFTRTLYLKEIDRFKNEMIFSQTDHEIMSMTLDDKAESMIWEVGGNKIPLSFTYDEESKIFTMMSEAGGSESYRATDFEGVFRLASLTSITPDTDDNGNKYVVKRVNVYDDNDNILAYETYVDDELEEKVNYIPLNNDDLFLAIKKSMGESDNSLYGMFDEKNIKDFSELTLSEQSLDDMSGLENFTELETLDLSKNEITDISVLAKLTKLKTLDLRGNPISDISSLNDLELEGLKVDLDDIDLDGLSDHILDLLDISQN